MTNKKHGLQQLVFFKCPFCLEVGSYVVGGSRNADFVVCGMRHCGRAFRLGKHRIAEDEYRQIRGGKLGE
jgi:hypothetical protein